jgi:hypothetical protein
MCKRPSSGVLLASAVSFLLLTTSDGAQSAEPVEALRKLLQQWDTFPNEDTPKAQKEVMAQVMALGEKLQKQAAEIRSLADLGQTLLLPEWNSQYFNRNPMAYDITAAVHRGLSERFRAEAKGVIARGDVKERAALAALVSSLADLAGGESRRLILGMLRDLTPDLLKLATAKDNVPVVALMLGKLGNREDLTLKEKTSVVAPLAQLLASKEVPLAGRRAAAVALEDLIAIRVDDFRPRIPRQEETLPMVVVLIPAAAGGLGDRDAEVRGRCLEAVRQALLTLRWATELPSQLDRQEAGQQASKTLESLLPVFEVVEKLLPAMPARIEDEETPVRVASCRTVETVAEFRRELLLAEKAGLKVRGKRFEAPWREALRRLLPALEKNLAHKEVRVRLGALYALESFASEAASVAGNVVRTLADESLFVRWAGVRVLGRTAPEAADKAVPALAQRLADDSEDVRVTAALVLGRYGPSARPALPALERAVEKGNAALRLRALLSLAAIGREANDSQPAILLALAAPEPEVRRAAVQALSRIGPLSEKATAALRKALADDDAEVRRAASIALLQGK